MNEITEFFDSLGSEWDKIKKRSNPGISFLCESIRQNQIANVVEVGTYMGKSAVCMAMAVRPFGGQVRSINVSKEEIGVARELASLAGLDNIEFIAGSSLDVLPRILPSSDFGMVFVDGYHDYTHSMQESRMALNHIRQDCGILILDDVANVHNEGRHDGGVPRTVKEIKAEVVSRSRSTFGIVTVGSAIIPEEPEWSV